jgi:hypothetical protein
MTNARNSGPGSNNGPRRWLDLAAFVVALAASVIATVLLGPAGAPIAIAGAVASFTAWRRPAPPVSEDP